MAETPKSPSILKTLNDIFKILPMYRQKFMKFYCKYKTKPIKVVTKIWTYNGLYFSNYTINIQVWEKNHFAWYSDVLFIKDTL